ncbi:MAG: hypothetical protein ACRDBH_08840 [Bosea sp. (in: a-proteobacteria)]
MVEPQSNNRKRDRSLQERSLDWVKIGAEMLAEAARHSPPDLPAGRRTVMLKRNIGEGISRKVVRMAELLRRHAATNPDFANTVSSVTTGPAEVLLRWAEFDPRGAAVAATAWRHGRHTIISLTAAERAARARAPGKKIINARVELERRAIDSLAIDAAFDGWSFRPATRQALESLGLEATLATAGVDALAIGPLGEMRAIMVVTSVRDDRATTFARSVLSNVWLARGVATTGLNVWLVVVSRNEHPDAIALAARIGAADAMITLQVISSPDV